MLLGSVDVCSYNNGVNSIAFGGTLVSQITALTPVLSLLPHLHLEAQERPWNASDQTYLEPCRSNR
jgi:hypothetical protein